jgi:hypothetical protein
MADVVVDAPTYMRDIRHFFDGVDLEHMLARGIDLTTYPALRAAATRVFQHTRPPNADMPPDPARRWSQERSTTFRNWITAGLPLGTPDTAPVQPGTGDRIRKDARDLTDDEITTLRTAFQGLMDRPGDAVTDRAPTADDNYFGWASVHGLPDPFECLHHEDRFLPWHRPMLIGFEDALRSVPGCEHVTLPFWDITAEPPAFLYTAPFSSFTLPRDIGDGFAAGDSTQRNSATDVLTNVNKRNIPANINAALSQFDWGTFRNTLEGGGHDNGHPSTGATMSNPEVATYDPIFWFFHANWDRLWWEWQQTMQATTEWTFRSTITDGQSDFLTSGFDDLPPFTTKVADTIDLAAAGVGYALAQTPPPGPPRPSIAPLTFGSLAAARAITVQPQRQASVRLKGIDRLAIPGTFEAVLSADGVPVARQAFFQPIRPRECIGCREKGTINLDLMVDVDAIIGRDLTTTIQLLTPGAERIGRTFPLSSCGNPTLNVRLPLQGQT